MSRGFLWGAATSGHQIEGHNVHSDWWAWEKQGNIEGGVDSGAATDHWNRCEEDLKLAASLGLNSYRFSVEWSRIEPAEGAWEETALDWYERLIGICETLGLLPMLTLHHFTLPRWVAEQGGFASPRTPALFLRFVQKVHARFGSRIPVWCTINEPVVLALGCYVGRFMPPGEFAPAKASHALAHLLRAHVLAYDFIHQNAPKREGPFADHPLQVGIAHNMLQFLPDRAWHPIERLLAQQFHQFYNRSFLDAVTGEKQRFRVPGLIPAAPQVTEAHGRRTVDFIGVNYYTKAYVQWRPSAPAAERPPELPIGVTFARRHETVSDVGWAVFPEGFRYVLDVVSRYRLPVFVTENGIADKDDAHRAEYLRLHLREVEAARDRGVDIRGYYYWSLLDNFEWVKGFGPRFGLFEVNYETFERKRRPSADVFAQLIRPKK